MNEVLQEVDEGTSEVCPICFEEMNDASQVGRLGCKHCFHRDCVAKWLLSA